MNKLRAYVPTSPNGLQDVVTSGGVGPPPVLAHAVTDAQRADDPDGAEEDWEYAAMSAAAQDSLGLLGEDDPPRRMVIALDVGSLGPVGTGEPTLVELHDVVPARGIAAVHVDSADAEDHVAAARVAWSAAQHGDEAAASVVERCLDHELGWFAAQEIGDLPQP